MGLFLFSKSVCDDVQKLMARFWWGKGKNNDKGMHWMSWERLARPKTGGVLALKSLGSSTW